MDVEVSIEPLRDGNYCRPPFINKHYYCFNRTFEGWKQDLTKKIDELAFPFQSNL